MNALTGIGASDFRRKCVSSLERAEYGRRILQRRSRNMAMGVFCVLYPATLSRKRQLIKAIQQEKTDPEEADAGRRSDFKTARDLGEDKGGSGRYAMCLGAVQ